MLPLFFGREALRRKVFLGERMSFEDGFAQFQPRLTALRMKASHLSAQTGISSGTLSQYASGQLTFTYPSYNRINHIITICEALQARTALPINWQDAPRLKTAIEDYENEQRTPPGELTQDDWNLLSLTISSTEPSMLLSNLGITRIELLKRLEETNRRFEGAIEAIRKSNADNEAHTQILNQRPQQL
jgi:transcriptional regulator with XRE-family HTH domain